MNIRQIIFKNIALQLGLVFFNLVMGIYSILLIARYLGIELLGKYNFVFSFYAFFIASLDFGLSFIVLREISKNRQDAEKLMGNFLTLKIFIGIFLILIAIIAANILPLPKDLRLAVLFYSPVIIICAFESIQVIFQVDLKQEYIVLASFFWRVVSLLLVIFAIRLNLGLVAILVSFVLAELVRYAVFYIFSRRIIRIQIPAIDIKLWTGMFRAGMPVFITSLSGALIRNMDVMLLTKIKGFIDVGLYATSYRLSDISLSLPISLIASVFPLMSKFYKQDFNAFKRVYQGTFDILSICGILLVVLVLALSDKIILFLFGIDFIRSAISFRILIFSALFVYLFIGAATLLIVTDNQRVNMWFGLLGASVNIVLNIILIPIFGFIGAAISNISTMLLVASLTFYFVSAKMKISLGITKIKKAVIAGLVTLAILFYLNALRLFVLLPIGVLLYGFLVFWMKAIDIDDIRLLMKKA